MSTILKSRSIKKDHYAERAVVLRYESGAPPTHTNALIPVMARPTIKVLISRVPS